MTLTQLTTDLTTLIGPGLDISNDNLATWINEGYASMCDALAVANPDYFTKSATADLATGIQEYDLPSDFERVLMVNVAYDGTNWVRCRPLENVGSIPAIMQTANGQGANTADPFYYILGGNIGLLPIPTASGNENLKLWYVYTPAALTDSSDSPVLPAKYHPLIKYSADANF